MRGQGKRSRCARARVAMRLEPVHTSGICGSHRARSRAVDAFGGTRQLEPPPVQCRAQTQVRATCAAAWLRLCAPSSGTGRCQDHPWSQARSHSSRNRVAREHALPAHTGGRPALGRPERMSCNAALPAGRCPHHTNLAQCAHRRCHPMPSSPCTPARRLHSTPQQELALDRRHLTIPDIVLAQCKILARSPPLRKRKLMRLLLKELNAAAPVHKLQPLADAVRCALPTRAKLDKQQPSPGQEPVRLCNHSRQGASMRRRGACVQQVAM